MSTWSKSSIKVLGMLFLSSFSSKTTWNLWTFELPPDVPLLPKKAPKFPKISPSQDHPRTPWNIHKEMQYYMKDTCTSLFEP